MTLEWIVCCHVVQKFEWNARRKEHLNASLEAIRRGGYKEKIATYVGHLL